MSAPVKRAPRLYMGVVRGRRFAHDPDGHDALVLLSPFAARLLERAWGSSLGHILAALADGPVLPSTRVEAEVHLLLRTGLLRSDVARPTIAQREPAFHLWLHLTNACNLDCPYCYIAKSKDHLSDRAARRMLDSVEATAKSGRWRRIHARYAGGEPMLQFERLKAFHADAVRRCDTHDVRFSAAVLSNGTLVPDGAPEWLLAHGVSLSVSVDGLGELQDTMRPRRGGGGSFALLERGLDRWMSAGVKPYVLITVGHSNLAGLPELTQWLLERNLSFRYSLVRDLTWGRAHLNDRLGAGRCGEMRRDSMAEGLLSGPSLDEVREVFHRCYDLIERKVARFVDAGQPVSPSFRGSHQFCDLSLWHPIRKACGAGNTYAALGDQGTISPCQAALHGADTAPLTSDVAIDQQLLSVRPFGAFARRRANDTCNACRHKPSCAGGCPLLLHRRDGHIDGRSPYCEVFRAVIPRILRIAALETLGRARRPRGATT